MKHKIYLSLMILFIIIAGYAFVSRNEFADIVGMFSCIAALICCVKGRRYLPYQDRQLRERRNCFMLLNKYKPDIAGGSNLDWQVEALIMKLRSATAERNLAVSNGCGWMKQYNETVTERDLLENRLAMLRTLYDKTIIERDNALEQRTADWDRIHILEKDVDNLKAELKVWVDIE